MPVQQQGNRVVFGFSREAMETKQQIETVAMIAYQLPLADVEDLVTEYRQAQAIASIFDPTGFQQTIRTAQGHYDLAGAFLTFRRAIEKIVSEGR